MSSTTLDTNVAEAEAAGGVRRSTMEVATSLTLAAIGTAAIWDSLRLGAGWGTDGPQTGTFPFWIGLILVASSLATLRPFLRRAERAGEAEMFVTWPQLALVMRVLVPTIVYVAAIPVTGLYLASAALVMWFMTRLGEFRWQVALPAGLATAVFAFVTFEIWFLVGLPKGPLETWLGY